MGASSWLAALISTLCIGSILGHSRTISVNLDAKWNHTPLLLEASEFLAQESNDHFWKFVESIAELPEFQKFANTIEHHDEALYHTAIKLAGRLLSPLQLKLLEFSLALRSNSPSVEMYNQIGHDVQEACDVFVEVNNIVTCQREGLSAFIQAARGQPKPILIKHDHHYPGTHGREVTVILYAQVGTLDFYQWHVVLKQLAEDGVINYVLRHYIKGGTSRKVRLSGYGVELAIKSTEYKAKDDTKVEGASNGDDDDEALDEDTEGVYFNRLRRKYPDLKENLAEFKRHLLDKVEGIAPLKVWQLQDLSFQAAQKVVSAEPEKALETLRDLSQNFPVMARSLVRTQVSAQLRKEVFANQKKLGNEFNLSPGDNMMFVNGLEADLEVYDVFNLLETLRSEAKLMEGLYSLAQQFGVEQEKLSGLLRLDLRNNDKNYAIDIRDPSVVYINDLEKDRKYSSWPGSVQDLLRPTFPGMLRHIRKNLFHLVFCVNPADVKSREILKMAEAFYVHNAPARLGFVFVVDDDDEAAVAMVRAFNYIRQEDGGSKALSFITDVYQKFPRDDLTLSNIKTVFKGVKSKVDMDDVFGEDSQHDYSRQEMKEYFEQTGLGSVPQVLLNGVPLSQEEISSDEFEEAVVSTILHQTPELQKAVYNGHLNDRTDALDYIMMRPNVMPRINSRVLAQSEKILDFSKDIPSSVLKNKEAFAHLQPSEMTSSLLSGLKYLSKKEEDTLKAVTVWVVCDLETPEGRELVYNGIKHMKTTNNIRLAIIHNPSDNVQSRPISKAIQVAMETLSTTMAKNFVTKLVKEENVDTIVGGDLSELAVGGMDYTDYESSLKKNDGSFIGVHKVFCEKLLEIAPGQRAVIVNGKVLGPLKTDEKFLQADFSLLEKYSYQASAGKIADKVKKMSLDGKQASELVMKADSLLSSVPQKEARKDIQFAKEEHSVLKIAPSADGPAYEVVAIFDPATRAAQKYTPLIMVLQQVANVNIKVFFNCRDKLSAMPLNSFYRYVLEPQMKFAVDSSVASGPLAQFRDMPLKPILTLGMDPPESWLVEAVRTAYDLDNIHLEEVEGRVDADFELEYLLLEGHCHDANTGQPPRGLQYTLGTQNKPAVVDTIVMANLGYFQLKATPGMWFLKMRGGRSEEIFEVVSHDNTDSPEGSKEVIVVMDSFKSKIIRVKVGKKPGMEHEDLLSDSAEPELGLWDSISSKLTGSKAAEDEDETINIFSLASGHMYERLLRIMMTSVLKHTQTKVKFWFLKNYLSPSFKDFIPHMAKEYGFEFELVQYKWPRWLHQQTEKQRIIWGYKILFLDVLFPLSINKIIFVDADQIVRTDLKELRDFDLEGAPYGYTPFCDSRKEMDGFRFWKSGYWASHLAGRKYHISALYVVDLKKFRKIAAGDRLRGQYQGLSQDPNSLSNLDQDLPNNMIHQVGIKSLPQEWLFCETWCDSSELQYAKTIDLCNNPLTKEPKLTAAQRIVPEWTDYDQQIKTLWDRVYNTNTADKSQRKDEL